MNDKLENAKIFDLDSLVRPNIKALKPYRSARDDFEMGTLLDANENSFGPPFAAKEKLNRYPSPYQYELRQLIADYRSVKPENVFVGAGSDEAIDLLYRIFCDPGQDRVIITPPTYGMYKVSANIHDIQVDEVLLTPDFQPRPQKILDAVQPDTKLLFLCSPNNPTGNDLNLLDIERLLDQFTGILILDEAYIDFSDRKSMASVINKYPNLVVLQTMSKAFGLAGIRLGIAIAAEEIIEYMRKVKAPYNVNSLTSRYAIRAFDHLDTIQANIQKIIKQREHLIRELKKLDAVENVTPSDANFILFKIARAYEVYQKLAEAGIIVRYRGDQPHCENGLRVTVGTPSENKQFLNEFEKVIKSLKL